MFHAMKFQNKCLVSSRCTTVAKPMRDELQLSKIPADETDYFSMSLVAASRASVRTLALVGAASPIPFDHRNRISVAARLRRFS